MKPPRNISMIAKAEIKVFEFILGENGMCCGVQDSLHWSVLSVYSGSQELKDVIKVGGKGLGPDELPCHPGN